MAAGPDRHKTAPNAAAMITFKNRVIAIPYHVRIGRSSNATPVDSPFVIDLPE